ncbi:MAG: inositol monophosphatase family protein [Gammaproteobacteria bacterium]|nr:inositol monophosphatase family protein [Gammaproteobacteria bacterium]
MKPALNIAVSAARAAGQVILRNMNRMPEIKIHSKGINDFVSEVDHQAEKSIISIIQKAYPSHAILAEESGQHSGDDCEWIIDPLDGTTNYLHGVPQFSVSIAMREKNKLQLGVVYDPLKEELFCASRGEGATLNNRRIRVSKQRDLSGSLIGTGLPYRDNQELDVYLATLRALLAETSGIRRAGSAALDLAYVAAGRFDGFWEFGLNTWDIAAGVLLIQEAGGLVSDLEGGHTYLESGNIVAANSQLYKNLITTLNTAARSA